MTVPSLSPVLWTSGAARECSGSAIACVCYAGCRVGLPVWGTYLQATQPWVQASGLQQLTRCVLVLSSGVVSTLWAGYSHSRTQGGSLQGVPPACSGKVAQAACSFKHAVCSKAAIALLGDVAVRTVLPPGESLRPSVLLVGQPPRLFVLLFGLESQGFLKAHMLVFGCPTCVICLCVQRRFLVQRAMHSAPALSVLQAATGPGQLTMTISCHL